MTAKRFMLYALLLCFSLSLAGCDFLNSDKDKKPQKITFKVYRPNQNGDWLVAELHEKELKKDEQPLRVVLETLLSEQPTDKDLVNIFPKKVKLLDVKIQNDLAEINLSKEVLDSDIGGSLSEMMIVTSIVNTVTEFTEIKNVQILVEGQKVESIAGHMDVLDPLQRNESIIKK